MPSVKSITLVNGLKIVHVPHNVGSVTACLRGLAGSNYEKDDEIGAAHVLEHLCSYATSKYNTPKKLRNVILSGGGRVTGTTSRDDVAFFAKVLKKDLPQTIEYLGQIFSQPILSFENLKVTINIIKHEIYQNIEDPKKHIGRISYKILYPNQRLAVYNTGRVEDLEKLSLEKVVRFKERLYYPANFVLSVCGDFPSKKLFALAEEYFGKIIDESPKRQPNLKPSYKPAILLENRDDLAHMHLKIDYHGYKTDHKMKYPAYLLAIILRNRLNTSLRSDNTQGSLGSVSPYILDSSSFNSNSYGLFGTYTAIKSEQFKGFLETYKKVTGHLSKNAITQQELLFARNKAQADLEFALEKTSLRADFYSELYLYQNLTDSHEKEISRYANCTKKNILDTAKDVFSQNPKMTIIDNKSTKPEVEKVYRKTFLN